MNEERVGRKEEEEERKKRFVSRGCLCLISFIGLIVAGWRHEESEKKDRKEGKK